MKVRLFLYFLMFFPTLIISQNVEGCTDPDACNYNPGAVEDDGSCLYTDCNDECGGTAFIDDCENCVGGSTGLVENYAMDCAGVCFGDAMLDMNGECCGGSTGIECVIDTDNDGIPDSEDNCPEVFNEFQLDYNQNGIGDVCESLTCEEMDGVSSYINASCESDSDCSYFGYFGDYSYSNGEGWLHSCCYGVAMNSGYASEYFSSYNFIWGCVDNYMICDMECEVIVYGACVNNTCAVIECPLDCNGDCNGTAFIDDCENCVGGNTGLEENYAMDCAGVCFGDAMLDMNGECCGGSTGIECVIDTDNDGISDNEDNCPDVFNEFQLDYNQNGIGDVCESLTCEEMDGVSSYINASCESDSDCSYYGYFGDYSYFNGEGWLYSCCYGAVMNSGYASEYFSSYDFLWECVENFMGCDIECEGSVYSVCVNNTCALISCQLDCNGDCNGTAFIDDCENCVGGNTGLEENYTMDCTGVCFGDNYLDDCGVCDNDPTNDNECFGCTDPEAANYNPNAIYDDGSCFYCIPGDVTGDDIIDILDVVEVVGCILEMSDDCPCGDMTGDGVVDVIDVVQMVDVILGG